MPFNAPNRILLDAFSDPQLSLKPTYSSFTTTFPAPILNAKSCDVVNVTLVNTTLQLNDASQLTFWYYAGSNPSTLTSSPSNLYCVRLLPSDYVPAVGFASYTKNEYFNTVTELVAALNSAAGVGGDSITYNPSWRTPNTIQFQYDATERKIKIESTDPALYIAPAAFDDPNVLSVIGNITVNGYNNVLPQPCVKGETMNPRLGFTQGYYAKGLWWSAGSSVGGVASSTGVAQTVGTPIDANTSPILLGSQFCGVYLDIIQNGGYDPVRRNLLANIPISVPSLNVISYIPSSAHHQIEYLPETISSVTVLLIDEHGVPFTQPSSYNVRVELSIGYE